MTEPKRPAPPVQTVPRLRRDVHPTRTNGRGVVVGAFIFFLVLLIFVIVLVVTIGVHNQGVKIPPGPVPHATQPS